MEVGNMKKLLTLLLAIVLAMGVTACTNSEEKKTDNNKESKNEDKTVITVWRHSGKPEEQDNIKKQIEAFNSSNSDIEIKYEALPEGAYNDQVNAAALSKDLPDIFMLDGPNMSNYAWAGYLTPLDDYITDELKNDLLPSIVAQGTYNGKLYALGTFDSGLAIWGNKAYLEKAGVRIPKNVEDAWTLDEFNDALEKLQGLEEVKYAIDFKINYGQGEWFTYGFSPILQSFGGDLINRDTLAAEGSINGTKSVEALKWFQSLFEKGYANATQASDDDFYGSEKSTALSFVGHWMTVPHKEALGDNLILIPMPKFGEKVVTGMGSWAWAISSQSKNPDAAWKVLEHLTSKENIKATSIATGAVPARKSVLGELEDYTQGGLLYIYREQLEGGYALERPTTPAYPNITTNFAEAVNNIINGSDVKEQLDKAAVKIDQDIKDNNNYK